MNKMEINDDLTNAIIGDLGHSNLFSGLEEKDLREIARNAEMIVFDPGETIVSQGAVSDGFYLLLSGEVQIMRLHEKTGDMVEIARVKPYETIGELGLILGQKRSATVIAGKDTMLLRFSQTFFTNMFHRLPTFAMVTCKVLAKRLQAASRNILPVTQGSESVKPEKEAFGLLPIEFIQRHRVLPIRSEGNVLHLGFLEDPTPKAITMVKALIGGGMEMRSHVIDISVFDEAMKTFAGTRELAAESMPSEPKNENAAIANAKPDAPASTEAPRPRSERLDVLLRRMIAEGASDLHLSGGHKPRWRVDGDVEELTDTQVMGHSDVYDLIAPILPERNKTQYASDNDTDFAYAVPNLSRFRVNLFRDNRGVGAVLRQIPDKILSIEQLGLPPVIEGLCDNPKGLILVTGPTGSGKSTTLAAMIDKINRTRKSHIITLEDPIEFVHKSQLCLVNQREIGPHTHTFARALRAALREDPDIVLVGEMRDLETVSMALETANTGHLVFGTLHTNTAVSTVSRILDMFPAEQQPQIRSVLADILKGVICQTLCRRIGGGRVAALEILVTDLGVSSLIREGKTHQMLSAMQTGRSRGNRILNDELARLVGEKIVEEAEAMSKAVDKPDLALQLKAQTDAAAAAAAAAAQPARR
jgi:twitching motility protein PilT